MTDLKAFYKISYGLYIVCSGDKTRAGGYISNSVFQVTAEPAKFAVCCNKNNFTASLIQKSSAFAISVLHRDSSPEIIGRFGFKSSKDTDKLAGLSVKYGETGIPVVLSECIAWLECRVEQIVDAGTHLIFIGRVLNSEVLDEEKEPMTYNYYRLVRKGFAPKNAPTYIDPEKLVKKATVFKKFRCPVCGYIYDEEAEGKPFAELPADWICPVCGTEKSEFVEI